MTAAFLAWRQPGHRWFPIGRLTREHDRYRFVYTRGVLIAHRDAGFSPLPSFPAFTEIYESETLFPVFANRLLSVKRPEFQDFLSWLNLSPGDADPLVLLTVSEGLRETDTFEVFACPEPDTQGSYRVSCFVHGLQHRTAGAVERAAQLKIGDRLVIEREPANEFDSFALKALTTGQIEHIGYLPRYLSADVCQLGESSFAARVERVNPPPAPVQFRVLCSLTAKWPEGFRPCSSPEFLPLPDSLSLDRQRSNAPTEEVHADPQPL